MQAVLQVGNERRLSDMIQRRLSELDCTHHFHKVNIDIDGGVAENVPLWRPSEIPFSQQARLARSKQC